MAFNKQSNTYTVIYIILLVVIVGTALAVTSLSLRDRQQQNVNADKMRQILAAALITPGNDVTADFDRYITSSMTVDSEGRTLEGVKAFDVDVAAQSKLPAEKRELPVFVCETPADGTKYILPVYGAGLWGPIWGYVAFDTDGSTIYGAFFAHQGETPGLGAEIEKPFFTDRFKGKQVFKDNRFLPIAVVKAGQKPADGEDYVDGISGGTITSKGVGTMLDNCLSPYKNFLQSLSNNTNG